MCKFTLLSLFFRFMVFSAKGETSIMVLQNMNGLDSKISSTVEVKSGTNISLVCKVVDTESKEKVPDRVVWSSKRKKIKFYNSRDINALMENNIPDNTNNFLNFTPITLDDEGTYLCMSNRSRQFKAIYVAVRKKSFLDGLKRKTRSRQRRHYNYRNFLSDHNETINKPQNQREPIKHEYYTQETDRGHKVEPVSTDQPDVLLKFIYMLLAAVGMFILLYAVTKCCHDDNYGSSYNRNRRAQRNRRRTNCPRQNLNAVADSARCTHPVCIQCRQDPTFRGCLFELHNVPTIRVEGPETSRARSPRPSVIPNIDHDDLLSSLLDLPPTYADSTANSPATSMYNLNDMTDSFAAATVKANDQHSHVLPPSYEQALINIVISPPDDDDTVVSVDGEYPYNADNRGGAHSTGSGRNG